MNIFIEEHQQLLRTLLKYEVSFMLIGGYAVIHYGYERTTGDMDIWLQTGNANRDKLLKALKSFGITDAGIDELSNMDFTNPLPAFFIGQKPKRIDFITLISKISFEEAIKEVNHFMFENLLIPVIHYNHLILSKQNTGRLKDLADIEELEKINKYKDNNSQ
ncbi:MAG: hypothetical protein ABIU30_02360 [Ferruginibacter sp.]